MSLRMLRVCGCVRVCVCARVYMAEEQLPWRERCLSMVESSRPSSCRPGSIPRRLPLSRRPRARPLARTKRMHEAGKSQTADFSSSPGVQEGAATAPPLPARLPSLQLPKAPQNFAILILHVIFANGTPGRGALAPQGVFAEPRTHCPVTACGSSERGRG